jgi:DNA transposition AAA+ family ATPase
MQVPPSQLSQDPTSNATEMSSQSFVETIEHRRFVEFCDAVRQFRYIGLCYGPPGIGKTRSARHYSRAAMIEQSHESRPETDHLELDTLFYTTAVINTPSRVEHDIRQARERLLSIAMRPLRREAREVLEAIRLRDEARRREILNTPGRSPCDRPPVDPAYFDTFERYEARKKAAPDPTTLIVVDEADRLHMNSLEQMRSIFDDGRAGMVLIGMPGIEKRIARFPQFYSRIGFVHEFRALDSTELQKLLDRRWTPAGVTPPKEPFDAEVMARLVRITEGNFRLLTRMLTQIERILSINETEIVSVAIVEAARDSLVIGQS